MVITRNLVLLALASFFTDVSSHIVFPLVPLFVTSVLGAGGMVVGLIEGAAESVSAALKAWAGHWSDRVARRKPFVVAGYAVSTVVKVGFAVATTWPLVLLARASERIGKGLRSAPRDALVVEEAPPDAIGRAFGLQRAGDAGGALVGALVAWCFIETVSFRTLFLWAVVPGVLGVIAAGLVRERGAMSAPASVHGSAGSSADVDRRATASADQRARHPRSGLAAFGTLPPALKRTIAGCTLFAFGQFGIAFFLLAATAHALTPRDALLLYVMFNATNAIASLPAGRWSDRVGRLRPLVTGYAAFVIASALLFGAAHVGLLALAFLVYGAGMALVDGTQRALVADLAPRELRATAMGAYHGAIALAALPGGFVAGLAWDRLGPRATFAFGIVATALAIALLLRGNARPIERAGGT